MQKLQKFCKNTLQNPLMVQILISQAPIITSQFIDLEQLLWRNFKQNRKILQKIVQKFCKNSVQKLCKNSAKNCAKIAKILEILLLILIHGDYFPNLNTWSLILIHGAYALS